MTDIIERLKDESQRLAGLSFDTVDAGIAANVADAAIDEIEDLRGIVASLLEIEEARMATGAFTPNAEAAKRISNARAALSRSLTDN